MPIAANAYILASLTRISALQELSILSAATDGGAEKANYKAFAKDCVPKLTEALGILAEQNRARVTELEVNARNELRRDWLVTAAEEGVGPRDREPPPSRYAVVDVRYFTDGTERRFHDERLGGDLGELMRKVVAQASAARSNDIERIEVDFMSKIGLPMRESINQVLAISQLQ